MVVQVKDPIASIIETSARGSRGLAVNIQDQTTQPIDLFFTEKKGTISTTNAVLQGGYTVDLTPGHGAVIGDVIEARTSENYVQATIVNVVGDTITVKTPWSRDFPAGVSLLLGNPNLNVVGSTVTNRIFSVAPSPLQEADIVRVIIIIEDASAMDFTTFGGAPELTNGCVLRYKNSDGTYTNLFNWASNGDIIARVFDHVFQSKIGGGLNALTARSTWGGQSKRGVVLRLDGALLEELEMVVQDDLTVLNKFLVVAQGHMVQN